MVTNINHKDLLDKRDKVIDTVLDNFNSWDGTMEAGIILLEKNQDELDKIETLNLQLSRFPIANNEEYVSRIQNIIAEQTKLTKAIKEEQQTLLDLMNQMSKKNQVINSYISVKRDPVFIDKDVR